MKGGLPKVWLLVMLARIQDRTGLDRIRLDWIFMRLDWTGLDWDWRVSVARRQILMLELTSL